MRSTKASLRYALSLLNLAVEQGKLEQVKDDMALISATISGSRDLLLMLQSPIIKTDTKQKVLHAIFKSSVSDMSLQFMNLIASKSREAITGDIAEAFLTLYKEHKSIVTAEVTTALPLTAEQREAVKKALVSSNKTIELMEKTDPAIIGGMQVKVGDKRIDASVRKKLNELRIDISKQKLSASN